MAAKHLEQIMIQAPRRMMLMIRRESSSWTYMRWEKILLIYTMKCSKHFFGAVFLDDGADTSVL